MKNKINLPKIYEGENPKFKQHLGKHKISLSQKNSFEDPQYFNGYILGYILGVEQPSNFWAGFGSFCGDTIACRLDIDKTNNEKERKVVEDAFEYFNEKDLTTLKKVDKIFPKNTLYEREIVLDCGEFVIQGFIDCNFTKEDKEVIIDVKTGNKNSKTKGVEYYKSTKYGQVNLYAEALRQEGNKIGYCGVVFLNRIYETERTHPGTTSTFESPILHLSGEIIEIENPYNKKEVDKLLKEFSNTVEKISSLKTTADKLKELTIKF